MTRLKRLICISVVGLASPSIAQEAVGVESWAGARDVVISAEAESQIAAEIKEALAEVRRQPALQKRMTGDAYQRALFNYLDANIEREKHPPFVYYLVEELQPGGLGPSFPTEYPVLVINASFEMTGVKINGDAVGFAPNKNKRLLLRIGSSDIATQGGGVLDCSFTVEAEGGKHYIRTCPDS